MIKWRIHHLPETVSTNRDALAGGHGDVYTADFQSSGRGRLGHRWISPPKVNLLMSVVLSVDGMRADEVCTLPLVMGLAVANGIADVVCGARKLSPMLKWPNDVLIDGRKTAGILCERHGDKVIVGVGVNVRAQRFSPEISALAGFLGDIKVDAVRDAVLERIGELYGKWMEKGFAALYPEIVAADWLKGRMVSVCQTDDDAEPITGKSSGIAPDGSLEVAGRWVFAGEAHVKEVGE